MTTVFMCLVESHLLMSDVTDATEMGVFLLALMTLWLYLPGFIANTFAMMWGKWFPKTGYGLGQLMVDAS